MTPAEQKTHAEHQAAECRWRAVLEPSQREAWLRAADRWAARAEGLTKGQPEKNDATS